MKNRIKKIIFLALLAAFVMPFTAFAADVVPFSSNEFKNTTATLLSSSPLELVFSVNTTKYTDELGITAVRLHDIDAGNARNYSVKEISSGVFYSSTIPLGSAVKGHRYYADVTFYADGITRTVRTNTVTY